jgi:hypothetical protein
MPSSLILFSPETLVRDRRKVWDRRLAAPRRAARLFGSENEVTSWDGRVAVRHPQTVVRIFHPPTALAGS